MKLYKVIEKEGYETFGLLNRDWKIMKKYEGIEKITDDWGIRELRLDEKNNESDIAYFTNMPYSILISNKAYENLSSILDLNDIELLPTKYKEQKYFLLHGIKAYDVNYELIEISSTECKIRFSEEELIEKGLNEKGLFRIRYKGGAVSDILFTDKFIEIINEYNLKGCEFRVEWDSREEYK